MKVLIVNVSDCDGGAARAAYRQHLGLLAAGVDSMMLVHHSRREDDSTIMRPHTIADKALAMLRPHIDQLPLIFYKPNKNIYFSPGWFSFGDIVNRINELNPDIVHLHWINKGMLTVEDVERIKPLIVWTMHDTWAFTGGCHTVLQCDKYLSQCGACPALGSKKKYDLSTKIFDRKKKTYSKVQNKVMIIAVSKWLESCARKSSLLSTFPIVTIHNPLNTNTYKPLDKTTAKSILNIKGFKRVILFGAMSAINDVNKGYSELVQAINRLKFKAEEVEIIVFGSSQPKNVIPLNYKVTYLGHLFDDISLQVIYSAADVMVVPSRQEAFGQTASEAMSCGTPVVAFGTSGLLDIVDHKVNGYLAEPYSTDDLAYGIEWVLNYPSYNNLAKSARNKVLHHFDSKIITRKLISIYKAMLLKN